MVATTLDDDYDSTPCNHPENMHHLGCDTLVWDPISLGFTSMLFTDSERELHQAPVGGASPAK